MQPAPNCPARMRIRSGSPGQALTPERVATAPAAQATTASPEGAPVKRGRGRPRKHPLPPEGKGKKDYSVGRNKPPVEHRFKKGQSGNPAGRPKGSEPVGKIIEDVYGEIIPARINGKVVKISKGRALIVGMLKDALNGDRHARREALKLMERHGPSPRPEVELEAEDLAMRARDEEIANAFLASQGWGDLP